MVLPILIPSSLHTDIRSISGLQEKLSLPAEQSFWRTGDRTFIEKGYGISAKQYKKFSRITGVPRNLEIILRLLFFFFKRMADPRRVDTIVREDDQIDIGRYRAKILETPGHSRGSVGIYLEQEQALFCGDTVIKHITPNAFVVPDEDATLPVRLSQDEFLNRL